MEQITTCVPRKCVGSSKNEPIKKGLNIFDEQKSPWALEIMEKKG